MIGLVWCKWCKKAATCSSRRDGPTVCAAFISADNETWLHTMEDVPPVLEDGEEPSPP